MKRAAATRLVHVPEDRPTHRYGFRGGDRSTLYCVPCRASHWIVLADPRLRQMTLATLRDRGELEEGID